MAESKAMTKEQEAAAAVPIVAPPPPYMYGRLVVDRGDEKDIPVQSLATPNKWAHGLCGCLENIPNCLFTCMCPCVAEVLVSVRAKSAKLGVVLCLITVLSFLLWKAYSMCFAVNLGYALQDMHKMQEEGQYEDDGWEMKPYGEEHRGFDAAGHFHEPRDKDHGDHHGRHGWDFGDDDDDDDDDDEMSYEEREERRHWWVAMEMVGAMLSALGLAGFIIHVVLRMKIRKMFSIHDPHDPHQDLKDVCAVFWCQPCVLCQEKATVDKILAARAQPPVMVA